MTQTRHYVFAGVAVGLAAAASAQSLDLDRAYSAELNADAAARTSQLQGGTAGNDGFFYISDGSGNYRLNMSGLIQFRYSMNFRDTQASGPDDETTIGFSVPRLKLRWHGNIVNPNWKFMVQGDFGTNGNLNLEKGYGQYDFEGWDGGFVRFGQFKLPILSEELVEPEYQLAAERSVSNEYFNQGYSQGIMLGFRNDTFSFHGAFSDGVGSALTPFNAGGRGLSGAAPFEADWALTARLDVKFEGDWERFDDFTSWRGDDMAFRAGAAIHWEEANNTNPSAAAAASDYELFLYTIDAAIEGNGWNAFAAFVGASSEVGTGAGAFDSDDYAAIVQAGIFITDQCEVFGRWDALFMDNTARGFAAGSDDDFHFLTFGANYYVVPQSHAAKITVDTVWSLNTTAPNLTGSGTVNGTGGLPDARFTQVLGDGDDGEFLLRAQLSVAF